MENLSDSAARWGFETSYFDVQGGRHDASPEMLRRVIAALGKSQGEPAVYPDTGIHPEQAFQGDGLRVWVLAVQLYGVRSARNWGHGDFTDLAALLEIVAKARRRGRRTQSRCTRCSMTVPRPAARYSPSSRLFINPLYIDVDIGAGLQAAADRELQGRDRAAARGASSWTTLRWRGSSARRCTWPAAISSRCAMPPRRRISRRSAATVAVSSRCLRRSRALRSLHAGNWPDWPEEWRVPSHAVVDHLRQSHGGEMAFHEYLQWIADRQLAHCRDVAKHHGMPIGLYLDTAIGVDASGADAWTGQRAMLQELSVGAPPDQYNPAGQDWGLTAYNPHGLIASHFEPFRRMLRASMRYAGAIRIDHVLGLMRLFVIPRGLGAADGVYLRCPFFAMLKVVAEESRRFHCVVIGEDLGTVPEGFRGTLQSWGLWSYLVMLFEAQLGRLVPPPGRISRDGDRDAQHARPADFRRLDERPRPAAQTFDRRRSGGGRRRAASRARGAEGRGRRRGAWKASCASSRRRRRGWSRCRSRIFSTCAIRSTCRAPSSSIRTGGSAGR